MTLYKHKSMKDVAALILYWEKENDNVYKLSVRWYSIHGHQHFGEEPRPLLIEHIRLTRDQIKEWHAYRTKEIVV